MTGHQGGDAIRPKKKLHVQFILMLMTCLVLPIIIAFALLVRHSVAQLKDSNRELLTRTAEQIADVFSSMTLTLYNISDNFANDEALLEVLQTDYDGNIERKRVQMIPIKNRFVGADTFNSSLMIDAIYTRNGEVFNFFTRNQRLVTDFYEPMSDVDVARIRALNVDAQENLAKLIWYPLQDNFFRPQPTGNLREDMILLGSRRTYHLLLGYYLNTHLFVIPEQTLYNQYKQYLLGGDFTVYLLGSDHGLLSSSNLDVLTAGAVPSTLMDTVTRAQASGNEELSVEGEDMLCGYALSERNGWTVLVTLPTRAATQSITSLVWQMLLVGIIISLLFLFVITYFSRRISQPLSGMIASMQRVQRGNFMPAKTYRTDNEIEQLTLYYNQMVRNLQVLIEEVYEKEKRGKELEAKVLMGQINPHFMYNTLELIVWKAHETKRTDIARIAAQLGHLLRMSVKDDSPFTLLSNEFAQALIYVDIQKARYKERLQVHIPALEASQETLSVLRFVLQPSIENAIVHGMRMDSSPLSVDISIHMADGVLTLRVQDDGIGMSAERLAQVQQYIRQADAQPDARPPQGSAGIGIRNIHQRLVLYFGDTYGLSIDSEPGKGTWVLIRMPIAHADVETGPKPDMPRPSEQEKP